MFITICQLSLHDYLFYATREMGRLYETETYLHNYGLTYALGLVKSPFASLSQVPQYREDLAVMNEQGVYVTPAHPLHYAFAFHTFKMANVDYYNFTPQVSTNQVVFGRAKELAPESTFEFYVLSEKEITLPSWIRLGKWMAKARVTITDQQRAQIKEGAYRAMGALNPLDLATVPTHCNVISMAPASLLTDVYQRGQYYEIEVGEKGHGQAVGLPVAMGYLVKMH
jgi:CRISPR-associated protein Csc1